MTTTFTHPKKTYYPMEHNHADHITQEAASTIVRTLAHYRTAAEHNGYLLPAAHSGLFSRKFIDDARTGNVFCPHFKHRIVIIRCVNPPGINELKRIFHDAVHTAIAKKDKFVRENMAGLLNLIALMNTKNRQPD